MAAMKKDVNLGLLLLIVAALLMFSGFTVYYQTTFKNLSNTYQHELEALEKVTSDLESKKGQLNETSVQLQLRKQKEEDLSKKYVDTKGERDQLETDKKKLEVDLAGTKSTLVKTQSEVDDLNRQINDPNTGYKKQVEDLDKQVLNLKSDVINLEDDVDDLERRIACLKSTAGASETC